jgi:transcriptional regulator with XRE-family HTH domain
VSPIEPASPALAGALRGLREARGLTQEEVALTAGITTGSLSRIETRHSNPTWTTVERIAQALGVSLLELCAEMEG